MKYFNVLLTFLLSFYWLSLIGQTPPTVTTAITGITATTATCGGNVTAAGSAAVTARGVVWSTAQNPTVSLTTKTSDGSGTGAFTSSLTGLTGGTIYYVRAYATSTAGTSYGAQIQFTTLVLPTVTTTAITSITATTATSGGNVTVQGSAAVTARGVVWSTTQNPTVSLATKTINGSGTGAFTSSLTGLTGGTIYYVRAYATSTAGTSYGAQVTFTTLVIPPTVTTTSITGITGTTATSGGNVTVQGSALVTARGIVWSTTQNPTVSLATKTSDGTGTGAFTSSLTGLTGGTIYYVRAYATSTAGTSYGAQVQFTTLPAVIPPTVTTTSITGITGTTATSGGNVTVQGSAAVTARGVVWSTTQNPTVSLTTKTING
ncbi:MAG: hypothetical protein RL656_882, partial [Bacteroidota bacterium]